MLYDPSFRKLILYAGQYRLTEEDLDVSAGSLYALAKDLAVRDWNSIFGVGRILTCFQRNHAVRSSSPTIPGVRRATALDQASSWFPHIGPQKRTVI